MLMGRAGLSPVMVGRSEELAVLRARVDSLTHHRGLPPVVVISGEAGVGKTRLLRELTTALAAATPPVPVLAGHGEEGGETRPFGLLVEALGRVAAGWDPLPEALAQRAHALGHVLAPILPEHEPADDHGHAPDELLLAAVEAIRHEVGAGPAVLLFEDLHWADEESIALFGRLATTEDLPVLLVGTLRPEDFDRHHPLARALPALERQRTVATVQLGRLGGTDLGHMLEAALGRAVPPAVVDALHRRTQGNPFFVEELVAATPDMDPAAFDAAPLPWNAAEAVLRRVDSLDAVARQVLDAAAVLGGRVPFDRLAAVSGLDEDALIGALRDLVDRGLLREESIDVFSFRHALTREAVAGQLLGREQRRLHRAALAALDAECRAGATRPPGAEDHPSGRKPRPAVSDVAAVARHAAGAGEWDRVIRTALEGAPRLRREGSARHAQALAELALEQAPELTDAEALALHALAARSAWEVGALDAAHRHAERWRRLAAAAADPAQESAALRQLWILRFELGDRPAADAALDAAAALATTLGPSVELAWVKAQISQRHMLDQEHEATIALADEALALAAEVDAPAVVPFALINKGTILTETPGCREEGLALLDEARHAALARHDGATAARALNNAVGHLAEFSDDAVRARLLLEEWRAVLDRYGQEGYRPNVAMHTTTLAVVDGDLAGARRALAEVGTIEDVVLSGVLIGFRALVEAEAGDAAAALALLPPHPAGDVHGERDTWVALGRVALGARTGDTAAIAQGLTLLSASERGGERGAWLPQNGPMAVILAAPSRVDDGLLEDLIEVVRRVPLGPRSAGDAGLIEHALAALAQRRHDHAAAIDAYRRAEEQRERPRPVLLRADLQVGMARSLLALGDRRTAAAHAAQAVADLERWPGWRRDEALALHRRLTGGPPGPGESTDGAEVDAPALTPREREVLALVARGLSNREIGERLYITTKTAAVHVSNILAKLGAASRTEAAAWLLRTDA